ncbi:MAG: hypothetical protein V1880_02740 [Patescibacteria group bacterium]
MPLGEIPKAPSSPEAAKDAMPKAPDTPKDAADKMANDHAVDNRRQEYSRAVACIRDQLTKVVSERWDLTETEKKAALDDITALVGQITAEIEAYDASQITTFKVSRKIGNLFEVEVGQEVTAGVNKVGEGPSVSTAKLQFRVAVLPLGVALGQEEYNEEGVPATNRYMEFTVLDNGVTNVTVNVAREEKNGKDVTHSATASVAHDDYYYLEASYSLPQGSGLPHGTMEMLATMGFGDVNAGAYLDLTPSSSEAGGRPAATGGFAIGGRW